MTPITNPERRKEVLRVWPDPEAGRLMGVSKQRAHQLREKWDIGPASWQRPNLGRQGYEALLAGEDKYELDGALHCRSDAGWEEVVW